MLARKVHKLNWAVVEAVIFHSDIPQMQGLPGWLWGFNLQLLQLYRDFCSSPLVAPYLGLSFGFDPISVCGPFSGICSPPRQERAKAAADFGTVNLAQAREG